MPSSHVPHSLKEGSDADVSFEKKMIVLLYYGLVVSSATHRLVTSCSVNLRNFPFDNQTCEIEFNLGSQNQYLGLRDGQHDGIELGDTLEVNDEWQNVKMTQKVVSFPFTVFGGHSYIDMYIIKITMDRNPVFYVIYLLIPSVLMAFVSVLVFLLPPDSGERVGLSITVLLSYTVFLLMVSEFTPRGGANTPILGKPHVIKFRYIVLVL